MNPVIPGEPYYNIAYEDSILFNSPGAVWIASINGTGMRLLCDSLFSFDASWSPDKNKIVFIGSPIPGSNTNWGIYQVNVHTNKIIRIAPDDTTVGCASYSPDGIYIAFTVYNDSSQIKIKLYNTFAKISYDLTSWMPGQISSLSWSPDSKKILIEGGNLIDVKTGELSSLFTFNWQIFAPSWSPDGSKIAFSSHSSGQTNIHIYDINTDSIRILYPNENLQFMASWSKDGSQLLFDQRPPGDSNSYICKIDVDGNNFVQITDGTDNNWNPCWYK